MFCCNRTLLHLKWFFTKPGNSLPNITATPSPPNTAPGTATSARATKSSGCLLRMVKLPENTKTSSPVSPSITVTSGDARLASPWAMMVHSSSPTMAPTLSGESATRVNRTRRLLARANVCNMQNNIHSSRLARAYQSLEGLCCGDAFGERFFIPREIVDSLIIQRALPAPPWFFTDDTLMALSIVSTLEEHEKIDQEHLAMSFAANYDSSRGYGPAMHRLLIKIRQERSSWREESQALFGGEGSFGNGSAMRVAPLGAYFADDLQMIIEQAKLSAVTTHCHPEAVAGAIAVALAAGFAWRFRESSQ